MLLGSLRNFYRVIMLQILSLQRYKVDILFLVPPLLVFLAKNSLVNCYDISSVRVIYCGASSISQDLTDLALARLRSNCLIRQGYGMTEATFSATLQKSDSLKQGSVGTLAIGTYAKVIDIETGKALGAKEEGELLFKGDQIMKGYVGDYEATRNAIDEDGWLHTGDIGYYDDDGHFYIVDRLKELIKYKGFQVPPSELESVLLSNRKIQEAAVVGFPDEICGEIPLAYVVKTPDVELTEHEIVEYVNERVSSAKRLRGGVRFVKDIPKNASGKILRRELRALSKNPKSKL